MSAAFAAYQALAWSALALGWPALLVKAATDPRYRVGWGERFGAWGPVPSGGVWVHGASVGEVRAATPLVAALKDRGLPLVLTTTSPSGRDAAAALVGPRGAARLLPLDLAPLVARALGRARPRALVIVETELWPALLRGAAGAGVPALLANGRISDRAFPRYRRLARWLGPLLGSLRAIQAQSGLDAERFLALGAPRSRVTVGGNVKFDVPAPDPGDPEVRALGRTRAGGWRVVVAGSTHPGEEAAVLEAAAALEGQGHRIGLVLAPRHLERLAEVEAVARRFGRPPARWSSLGEPREAGLLEAFGARRTVLVDRYGVLGRLYGGAEGAFVGGSLAPVGGHSLLEPLAWGVGVTFGPHMENAREIRDEVLARGLGTEVADAPGLARAWGETLAGPARAEAVASGARALFAANRGAVARALAALAEAGALGGEG